MSPKITPLFMYPRILFESRVCGDLKSEDHCEKWYLASKPPIKCVQLILHILSDEGEVWGPNCPISTHDIDDITSGLAPGSFSKEHLRIKLNAVYIQDH